MLNERDDKYDNYEDSEYHFSDEEVSYEVETETPKPPVEPKTNFMDQLTQSKRMLISVVVFLVLIFLVYKMLTPNTATPSTDIATPQTAQTPSSRQMAANQPSTVAQEPPTVAQQQAPEVSMTPPQQSTMTAPANQQSDTMQQSMTPPSVIPVQQPTPATAQPLPEIVTQAPQAQTQALPQTPSSGMMSAPTTAMPSQMTAPTQQQQAPQAPVMVVAGTPGQAIQQPTSMVVPNSQPMQAPVTVPTTDAQVTNVMLAQSEKLAAQLQADYTQKMNDFVTQNKALQDQLQTLSSRVASMENQMTQLMQAIVRQSQGQQAPAAPQNVPAAGPEGMNPPAMPAQPQMPSAPEPRIAYSVQAIIPGRAWLRSENGDTVTVAEGDTIKDVGRVTKIDPYDGVVEINVGNRTVSLSYGNGG